jgi:hypothetical protein
LFTAAREQIVMCAIFLESPKVSTISLTKSKPLKESNIMKFAANILSSFSIAIILFNFLNCNDSSKIIAPALPISYYNPELADSLKTIAIDTLEYKNNKYSISAQCYRDFFPPADKNTDHRLRSFITFEKADETISNHKINFHKQYVIYGDEVWEAELLDEEHPSGVLISRKGPNWPIGSIVDVVLAIEINDSRAYLIAEDITIRGSG